MKGITEKTEIFALKLLEREGYQLYGPSIIPNGDTPERKSLEDVLLMDRLRIAMVGSIPLSPWIFVKTLSSRF